MKSSTDEQRAKLLKATYGADTLSGILDIFRDDYKSIKNIEGTKSESLQRSINLFQRYLIPITYFYSLSSIKNNLKQFRAIIKKEGGELEEIAQKVFHVGGGKDTAIPSIHKMVSAKTEEKISEREQNQSEIEFSTEGEIKRIKTLLLTGSYGVKKNQNAEQVRSYYLAYILGLSGGRRFTEIFKTSDIRKNKSSYVYTGILKKDSNTKTKIEVNLIGLTIKEYRAYQRELRKYIDKKLQLTKKKGLEDTSIGEINSTFSKVYNNAIKRLSEEVIPNFHELRHHYTITGTELFKREGESERETRYRILGHEQKEDTTRTYATTKK